MNRILSALLTLTLSATLVPVVYADSACTNATLTGNYSFNFTGWYANVDKKGHLNLPNSTIVNVVGVATFDGAGNMSSSMTSCGNGFCGNSKGRGTYNVNSDCSGKLKFGKGKHPTPWTFAISNGGGQAYFIETDATSNISGTITKQ